MPDMRKSFFAPLPVLTVMIVLTGCAFIERNIKKPQITFQSFRFGEITTQSVELVPRLSIANPNRFPIPVDRIGYSLTLNGQKVFDAQSQRIGSLEANKSLDFDLPVRLNQQVTDFFASSLVQDNQITYLIQSNTNIVGFPITFSDTRTIHMPEVKTGSLYFTEISLKRVVASLSVHVENTNNFTLPFKRLEYAVIGNNHTVFSDHIAQDGIAKNTTTNLNMPFRVNPAYLFTSSLTLLKQPVIDLEISAVADFGFARLPFKKIVPVRFR